MTVLPYVIADVFTSTPLQGNPLAVFTEGAALDLARMQALARETNLSETVFVLPPEAGGTARVRIFTPVAELPFAGHPILGTAAILALARERDAITLETGRGHVEVTVERQRKDVASGRMVHLPPTWTESADAAAVLAALDVATAELPVEVYDNGPRHTMVALADADLVAGLSPDLRALEELRAQVSCFARAGAGWRTRCFCPALGVPEDPATGSAAGPIAVHLARHGWIAFGEEIEIAQGAEVGRPSRLRAVAHGSAERLERVEVAGAVAIVARGEFRI